MNSIISAHRHIFAVLQHTPRPGFAQASVPFPPQPLPLTNKEMRSPEKGLPHVARKPAGYRSSTCLDPNNGNKSGHYYRRCAGIRPVSIRPDASQRAQISPAQQNCVHRRCEISRLGSNRVPSGLWLRGLSLMWVAQAL